MKRNSVFFCILKILFCWKSFSNKLTKTIIWCCVSTIWRRCQRDSELHSCHRNLSSLSKYDYILPSAEAKTECYQQCIDSVNSTATQAHTYTHWKLCLLTSQVSVWRSGIGKVWWSWWRQTGSSNAQLEKKSSEGDDDTTILVALSMTRHTFTIQCEL